MLVQAGTVLLVLLLAGNARRDALIADGRESLDATAARVVRQMTSELRRLDGSTRQLATLVGLNVIHPTNPGQPGSDAIASLPLSLVSALDANRSLESIDAVFSNGVAVSASVAKGGLYRVVYRSPREGGQVMVDIHGRRSSLDISPVPPEDLRTRSWYRNATRRTGVAWQTRSVSRGVVVTVARRAPSPGAVTAVVASHSRPDAVSEVLGGIPNAPHGAIFVTPSDGASLPWDAHGVIAADSEAAARTRITTGMVGPRQPGAVHGQYVLDGTPWMRASRRMVMEPGLDWRVVVDAPLEELTAAAGAGRGSEPWLVLISALLTGAVALPFVVRATRPVENMHTQATTDALTGLPNRAECFRRGEEMVERARHDGTPLTVAMLDLDGFKQINDLYGHADGDVALTAFARRARACMRGDDLVGRIGGDEFVVVSPGIAGHDAGEILGRIISTASGEPVVTPHARHTLGCTIGFCDDHTRYATFAEMVVAADEALVAGKMAHKGLVYRSGDAATAGVAG